MLTTSWRKESYLQQMVLGKRDTHTRKSVSPSPCTKTNSKWIKDLPEEEIHTQSCPAMTRVNCNDDQHGRKTLGVQRWKACLPGNRHLFSWMETMPGSGNLVNYAVLEENLQLPLY